ncbi:Emopamil-binding protein [Trichocladium antarcticum]|uniref:Emopamil-binding protein n=1 Tax=Trichocladium antarcticum TaxID=1450529 RepID=A0AAN6ZHL6_9PEZI|nr:Emopamil-binding protein [Trichocladium antarcticum]
MEGHTLSGQGHPYFPTNAVIANYTPNSTPIPVILVAFGAIIGAFVLGCTALARWHNPTLKHGEQLTIGWFALCYYVLHHATLPASQSLFAQLWKEYALSDSRYLTSDPFMLCIETLTAITWGPLSLLTALLIATSTATSTPRRHATRHLLQAVVCVGHLYGVALYYGTCGFAARMAGAVHSRPEPLYYWGYYAGMNAPWAVVPGVLLWRSARAVRAAFEVAAAVETGRKAR